MGFNTACVVLNDTLYSLAADPTAGADIRTAILEAGNPHIRLAGHGRHGFQALKSVHANTAQVVVVGGNTIRSLGYGRWDDEDEALLRKLADQLGFRLVRKAGAK